MILNDTDDTEQGALQKASVYINDQSEIRLSVMGLRVMTYKHVTISDQW